MGDDWLDEADPPTEVVETKPVKRNDDALAVVEQIDQELERGATEILAGAMRFGEIPLGAKECPQEWIDEYGEEHAQKLFRLAQMAQLPSKDAPVGLKLAKELKVGFVSAKSKQKRGPSSLNVQVVKWEAPMPEFPVVEVDEDDEG